MATEIVVKRVMTFLERKVNIDEEEKEKIEYGLGALLYTVLSTVLLLLLGACSGSFFSTVIIIVFFYINQTVGGGYHAKTHIRCFITMVIGITIGNTIIGVKEARISFFCCIVGSALLLFFPLTLNKNKQYLKFKAKQMILRSQIITVGEILVLFVAYKLNEELFTMFSVALLLSGISRIVGYVINNDKFCD